MQVRGFGGGCFPAGERVLTPAGEVPIESLKVGDEVMSFDQSGRIGVSKVEVVHYHECDVVYRVRFWGGEFRVTPNHWVLNQYGSFAEVGTMRIGDALVDQLGHLRPIIEMFYEAQEPVYNLTVTPDHTFIAGGIRVHNGGRGHLRPVQGHGGGGGGGKGGGGGTSHVPTEAPDSLFSRQFAQVIDLVSEGEIGGLVDGLKSVYLDDTPVMNADGTYNFTGLTFDSRNGTQDQEYIPGFSDVESEQAVSTEVKNATPVTRTITNPNVNAVRVTIAIPQLMTQSTSGDISGTSVEIAIDLQSNGGGFATVVSDTISGKSTSRYRRAYNVTLTGSGPWDIRIRRITADTTASNVQNETWWDSYTEVINAKLRYPNCALMALQVSAEQFRTIPRRGYEIYGIKIRVPTNYDPVNRTYTGIWDGTFKTAWSDNPAWVYYDVLTEGRYALGQYIDVTMVDKWALYEIARYCDEMVPNGYGGTEPRYTCNVYIQTREEAYKVVMNLASIFRGITYWATGQVTAVADMPSDPIGLFTAANVVGGTFTYQGSSLKTRHTVALVTWNDPNDRYKQRIEYVEGDRESIAKYGIVEVEVTAIGCTSRGQAHRMGKWILYTEVMEKETVSFRTGLEGSPLYPGAIIKVADPARAGKRYGGRVVSGTTTSITLDSAVNFSESSGFTLTVMLPDGSIEERQVIASSATTDVVSLTAALSAAPQEGAIWMLTSNDLTPQIFRVLAAVEVDKVQVEVSAVAHAPEKFALIEQNILFDPRSVTSVTYPPAPDGLHVTEYLYEDRNTVRIGIILGWNKVGSALSYRVSYKAGDSNPESATEYSNNLDMRNVQETTYTFYVYSVDALGRMSQTPSTLTYNVVGRGYPPGPVTGLNITAINNARATLRWDAQPDLDVRIGGNIVIRHAPETSGVTIANSTLVDEVPGISQQVEVPLMQGTYFALARDCDDNYSTDVRSIVVDSVPTVHEFHPVIEITESPTFAGTKTNLVVSGGEVYLTGVGLIDDQLTDIDTWPAIDYIGGMAPEGVYTFGQEVDLLHTFIVRAAAFISVSFVGSVTDLWDSRLDPIDSWLSIDGAQIDAAVELQVSTSVDGVMWSAWSKFFVGDYTARKLRFRLVFKTNDVWQNISVNGLRVTLDVPARTESINNLVIPNTGARVSYTNGFWMPPAVGIMIEGMQSGDFYEITNKDETGFDFIVKNGVSGVSRTIDVIAKGFGYRV